MSSFINSIINRTFESTPLIQPRVRGKFEQDTFTSLSFFTNGSSETFANDERTPEISEKNAGKEKNISGVASAFTTKINESDVPVTLGNSFTSSRSKPSWISQLVSKDHYSNPESQHLATDNLIVPPHPVSEKIISNKKFVEGQSDTIAPSQSKSKNQDGINLFEEIQAPDANEDHKTIRQNRNKQALPASDDQPAILPFSGLYKLPSLLKSGTNDYTRSENTFRKDDFIKRGNALTGESLPAIETTQTINISIGRVEVRVSQPPLQALPVPKKEGIAIMSLDEYLDKRNHGNK